MPSASTKLRLLKGIIPVCCSNLRWMQQSAKSHSLLITRLAIIRQPPTLQARCSPFPLKLQLSQVSSGFSNCTALLLENRHFAALALGTLGLLFGVIALADTHWARVKFGKNDVRCIEFGQAGLCSSASVINSHRSTTACGRPALKRKVQNWASGCFSFTLSGVFGAGDQGFDCYDSKFFLEFAWLHYHLQLQWL